MLCLEFLFDRFWPSSVARNKASGQEEHAQKVWERSGSCIDRLWVQKAKSEREFWMAGDADWVSQGCWKTCKHVLSMSPPPTQTIKFGWYHPSLKNLIDGCCKSLERCLYLFQEEYSIKAFPTRNKANCWFRRWILQSERPDQKTAIYHILKKIYIVICIIFKSKLTLRSLLHNT